MLNELFVRYLKQERELGFREIFVDLPDIQNTLESPAEPARKLQIIYESEKGCQRCLLGKTRKSFVFGEGNPEARLMFIGEAPGFEEDQQGRPFIGPAGQLLNKMISAMGLTREEVYIANIIKCRPPKNRNPLPEEIESCRRLIHQQIDTVKPEFLCCLGLVAARTLVGSDLSLSQLRGRFYKFKGIPLMVTYHPSALLRTPSWKKEAWQDLQMLMGQMALLSPAVQSTPITH